MTSLPPRPEVPVLASLDLVIRTPRLVLRPYRETDLDEIWPYVSDPELPRMMSWAAHRDREETLAWLRGRAASIAEGTGIGFAVEHEGRAAGSVGLDGITWQLRAWRVDRAELGYWIAPHLQGRGLMTEAAAAVTRFGFETLGLHKITVGCIDGNEPSRRIIERLGFRPIGRLVDDVWRDGRWLTHLRYEMLASDWRVRYPRPLDRVQSGV